MSLYPTRIATAFLRNSLPAFLLAPLMANCAMQAYEQDTSKRSDAREGDMCALDDVRAPHSDRADMKLERDGEDIVLDRFQWTLRYGDDPGDEAASRFVLYRLSDGDPLKRVRTLRIVDSSRGGKNVCERTSRTCSFSSVVKVNKIPRKDPDVYFVVAFRSDNTALAASPAYTMQKVKNRGDEDGVLFKTSKKYGETRFKCTPQRTACDLSKLEGATLVCDVEPRERRNPLGDPKKARIKIARRTPSSSISDLSSEEIEINRFDFEITHRDEFTGEGRQNCSVYTDPQVASGELSCVHPQGQSSGNRTDARLDYAPQSDQAHLRACRIESDDNFTSYRVSNLDLRYVGPDNGSSQDNTILGGFHVMYRIDRGPEAREYKYDLSNCGED